MFNLITSDPDDNKFVDCAICGQAEYLVSNDKHFKVLNDIQFPSITNVTIPQEIKGVWNVEVITLIYA